MSSLSLAVVRDRAGLPGLQLLKGDALVVCVWSVMDCFLCPGLMLLSGVRPLGADSSYIGAMGNFLRYLGIILERFLPMTHRALDR